MALPSWLLVSMGGRRSQRSGPLPSPGSLGPSHQRPRVSLRVPLEPMVFRAFLMERCTTHTIFLYKLCPICMVKSPNVVPPYPLFSILHLDMREIIMVEILHKTKLFVPIDQCLWPVWLCRINIMCGLGRLLKCSSRETNICIKSRGGYWWATYFYCWCRTGRGWGLPNCCGRDDAILSKSTASMPYVNICLLATNSSISLYIGSLYFKDIFLFLKLLPLYLIHSPPIGSSDALCVDLLFFGSVWSMYPYYFCYLIYMFLSNTHCVHATLQRPTSMRPCHTQIVQERVGWSCLCHPTPNVFDLRARASHP